MPTPDDSRTQVNLPTPDPAEPTPPADNERPSSSGFLIFIGSFVIALIVFIGLVLLLWPLTGQPLPFSQTTAATTTATSSVVTQPTALYNYNDRVSVTVYITDDHDQLQSATLVMIQPDTEEFTVLGLPPQLAISETDTLYTRFRNGRAEACQLSLMTYFGKSVDYYVVLSYGDVQALFQALQEPMIVDLPVDVNEQSPTGGFSIHLPAGEQALSAKQTANLLQYNNWQGGITERTQIHATLVMTYLKQYLSPTRSIDEDYNTLLSKAECNLTGERFRVILPMLEYLAKKQDTLQTIVHYTEGTYEGAGDTMRFTPGPQSIDIVKATLR